MNSSNPTPTRLATLAPLLFAAAVAASLAYRETVAQTAPRDASASMVKSPESASGASSSNPDHMPIKRPTQPTHDPIPHDLPASATNAK
jgi:hypothetical protein